MAPAKKLRLTRRSGILLHPSSLPRTPGLGDFGIGDLGSTAYAWVEALVRAGQSWWQILPLGPPSHGNSPYQCFSAFAGNPTLISPEKLTAVGLLDRSDYASADFPADQVAFDAVIPFKEGLLDRAWDNFRANRAPSLREPHQKFCSDHEKWLDDFALFMAIKEAMDRKSWMNWPEPLRMRQPSAIDEARRELAGRIDRHRFRQFIFFKQWEELKAHANQKGLRLFGDIPIFVADDSADVWANPQLFLLDSNRRPQFVAGVPPDYFSADGQLWGNPLYDWNAAKRDDYSWWAQRIQMTLTHVDMVRIDHFRGLAAAWHVPAGVPNARSGKWVEGPGADLFNRLRNRLGSLPMVAEDLGIITPDVEQLRESLGIAGMRVLQFAFGDDSENKYLPHNYEPNTIVYTGTHDNDTTRGWYAQISDHERDRVRRYLARDGSDIAWDLIRTAWSSVADLAIAPLQDLLNLGSDSRMNTPGKATGNWRWRMPRDMDWDGVLGRISELSNLYGRAP
jgi:4-alpha-glucanotransferase